MDQKRAQRTQLIESLTAAGHDASDLKPIGVRPPLVEYLHQLWQRRHFIWMDASQGALTRNAGNILGNVWLILRPLIDAGFYFVIFGYVLQVSRGVDNFAAFLVIGILLYRSTAAAIGGGASLMKANRSMIRAFSFPRASIPISSVLESAITAVWTMFVMCAVIMALPPHVLPTYTWLLMVPIFCLHVLINLGFTLISARIGYHVPDMTNVLSVVSRFLMYGSGVMFPIERFLGDTIWRDIAEMNPLFQIISMARTVLMDGEVPALESWLLVIGWGLALSICGFIFFWRGESSYGRDVR